MRSFSNTISACLLVLISQPCMLVKANDITHHYAEDEPVYFYVHKVGPLANPQEAYPYYFIPYCAPKVKGEVNFNEDKSSLSLAEQLGGHALRHSGHTLKFASKTQDYTESCDTSPLSAVDAEKFVKAITDDWFYQMYIDDLPIWGMVGEMDRTTKKPMVITHRQVIIKYNGDRIIKVDLIPDQKSLVEVAPGKKLTFTTNFVWDETTEEFQSRFNRYLDNAFFKHQIHWFSLFNSFMMVLFLTGLVSLILVRTLRRDYARYAISSGRDLEGAEDYNIEAMVDENGKPLESDDSAPIMKRGGMPTEDSGWKQVHGEVFRSPWLVTLVAAVLGSGWQLIVLTLGVILFAVAGPLHGEVHEDRGELEHAILFCYCWSSIVAGYASGSYYKVYTYNRPGVRGKSGKSESSDSAWQLAMLLTALLLPTVCGGIILFLNGIALSYGTVNYIPFFALVKLFLLWIFISLPLCIVGTLVGRHSKKGGNTSSEFPCRVNAIPRPIPEDVASYGKPMNLIPFAGLLSFGSIFIELYYVLTSLWNYKIYHVYEFLLGVYVILIIVVSMTTIIVVYFCLNAENYLWQWISLASGGSTAGYVFLYGVYFFMFKTEMSGFLQTTYYFSYMSLISLNLGILCGTIGHFAASKFVRTIFQNVKVD